jgi:putative ABC transport system permease protein
MSDLRRISVDIDSELADHLERRVRATIWSGTGHDVRTAARRLAGQPASTAFTILTLALAIGVAAAVFSVVDQLILRPPPFLHADRLVNVMSQSGPNRSGGSGLTAEKILGWQQQPAVFERLEGYIGATYDLTGSAEPKQIVARVVSLGLFDMLGIRMHIGRPFAAGDGAPGSARVAILSHEFWTTQFGRSPGALGSQIVLNDERYTIVGVLRPRTTLFTGDEPVWLPFDLKAWGSRAPYRFFGIGRLNASFAFARPPPAADAIAVTLGESTPLRGTWHLGIDEKQSAQLAGPARQMLFVLLGAVALLLCIACVNVTSFALGQALRRERELRLRAAIGAGRWRLLRESLVETVLLAAAAGTLAAAIADIALGVLLAAAPDGMASMQTRPVEIDPRVLAVMTIVTLTAGLMTGLVPGMRSSRIELSSAIRDGARGSSRGLSLGTGIGGLVVVEVAMAMVLLVGAALMSRTLIAYYATEPGFDVDTLMTTEIALPSHRYPNEQARRDFFAALDAGLKGQNGIVASAYAWGIAPAAGSLSGQLQAEGRQPTSGELEYFANAVSPSYFETTGTRLVAGRPFTPADTDDQVILSEALARLLWGDEPALGRRMKQLVDGKWLTVVGVAGNVESRWDRGQRSDLQFYVPLAAPRAGAAAPPPGPLRRTSIRQLLIVKAANPSLVPAAVRAQIRALDPDLPVGAFASGSDLYARPLAQQQFLLTVMGAFAGIALLLAAMGIFGVLSQAVTRRRREIGIRRALGADSPRLIRMLVGRGVALAGAGTLIGAAASLVGVRTLEGLLFGVSPFDAASFALVAAVILVVALLACWWPTSRALSVEPAEVLRSE